jgi:hypothetical protein
VVDEGPMKTRKGTAIAAVRLKSDSSALRKQLIALGALWKAKARLWYMPRSTAKTFDLLDQVVRD